MYCIEVIHNLNRRAGSPPAVFEVNHKGIRIASLKHSDSVLIENNSIRDHEDSGYSQIIRNIHILEQEKPEALPLYAEDLYKRFKP
jgi:uncharacterized protein